MKLSTGSGLLRHAPLVALAAVLAGLGSYVLLVVVARAAGIAEYSSFAVFWSIAVTAGLGLYYPMEQETAREVATGLGARKPGGGAVVFGFAGLATLVISVATLCLLTPAGRTYLGDAALVPCLLAAFAASAVQFPVRGLLSGSARQDAYSYVVGLEGLLRIAVPLVLAFLGVTAPGWFALAVAFAALGSVIPALAGKRDWLHVSVAPLKSYSLRVIRLIVAAISIQALLNSPVLLARAMQDPDPGLAGALLASVSIARIPVFVYGVAQVLYMPAIARLWAAGEVPKLRRLLGLAGLIVVTAAILTAGAMGLAGGWLTALLFGSDLSLPGGDQLLIGVGVGAFLLALVASDTVLALGAHRVIIRSWLIAAIAGAVTVVVVQDPVLRTLLPLLVGALVAVGQLVAHILTVVGRRSRQDAS